MKPLTLFKLLPTLLISLLACGASSVLADDPVELSATEHFDFSFDGGTANDFLAAIEPYSLNFIVPENADIVRIPKFSVKNVSEEELFAALNILVENAHPDYFIQIRHPRLSSVWVLQLQKKAV